MRRGERERERERKNKTSAKTNSLLRGVDKDEAREGSCANIKELLNTGANLLVTEIQRAVSRSD